MIIGEQQPDGSFVERATTWSEIAEPEEIHWSSWRDLVNEAVAVRRRKKGANYSNAWYQNVRFFLQSVPCEFKQATPALIREWVHSMQDDGLVGRTIEMRCGVLASLSQICIRSGMLAGYVSPWPLVD